MQQFFGKYEVVRELGRGAMGVVYEALDPTLRRRVAVKTIRYDQIDSSNLGETLARLKIEAQAGARFSHPNIVGVFDYDESPASPGSPGFAYIAMEFVSGKSLKDGFDAGQKLDLTDAKRIILQVLNGLGHAHDHGVFHRDIKPANIIVLANGDIKIADFGIARIEDSDLTQVGTVMGTPSYMSPEQFHGLQVDHRTDLYSAGVLLYQMLTGDKPFSGSYATIMQKVLNEVPMAPSLANPELDRSWDAILKKALEKKPEDRFQSAAEFSKAIQAGALEEVDPDATVINAAPPQRAAAPAAPATKTAVPYEQTVKLEPAPPATDAEQSSSAAPSGAAVPTPAPADKRLQIVLGVCALAVVLGGMWGFMRGGGKSPSPESASVAGASGTAASITTMFKCASLKVETTAAGERRVSGTVDNDSDHAKLAEWAANASSTGGGTVDVSRVGVVPSATCEVAREVAAAEKAISKREAKPQISLLGHPPKFSYVRKEVIGIELTTPNFPSFVYAMYLTADGQAATRLYPADAAARTAPAPASAKLLVSDPKSLEAVVAGPPAGHDLLVVLASARKIDALDRSASLPMADFLALIKGFRADATSKVTMTQQALEIVGAEGP